jgi:hypothetical protein
MGKSILGKTLEEMVALLREGMVERMETRVDRYHVTAYVVPNAGKGGRDIIRLDLVEGHER